jgi:DNA-binding response OmpR family regulator
LLLEDDILLSKTLVKYLEFNGYSVDLARNGEEAVELSYENVYDVYVFDINVPLLNGVDLLSQLRRASDTTPTLIISALEDINSLKRAFKAGADDYIKKPFEPEELILRIEAKTSKLIDYISIKGYDIDLTKGDILKDKKHIYIPEVQKKIFLELVRNYPNAVSKENLMLELDKPTDLALRVNISKLKKILDIDIKNIRGVGYQII